MIPMIMANDRLRMISQLFVFNSNNSSIRLRHQWRRQLWGTGARAPIDFEI